MLRYTTPFNLNTSWGNTENRRKKGRAVFAERNIVGFSLAEEMEETFIELEVIKDTKEQRQLLRPNVQRNS